MATGMKAESVRHFRTCPPRLGAFSALLILLAGLQSPCAVAAPDEIQVYVDDIRAPKEFGVELHLNYAAKARNTPDYAGEVPPNHVFRATPEISLGIAPNWDVGIYLPLEIAPGGNFYSDTARLRVKYLAPLDETKPFFYGINLEYGYVPLRVSQNHRVAELRGIFGYRSDKWLLAVNPILGWDVSGPDSSGTPDIDLNVKVAREVNGDWAVGFEHYAGFGRINDTLRSSQQDQMLYLVADYERKGFGVNFGVGKGLTNASDETVVKAIVSFPF